MANYIFHAFCVEVLQNRQDKAFSFKQARINVIFHSQTLQKFYRFITKTYV